MSDHPVPEQVLADAFWVFYYRPNDKYYKILGAPMHVPLRGTQKTSRGMVQKNYVGMRRMFQDELEYCDQCPKVPFLAFYNVDDWIATERGVFEPGSKQEVQLEKAFLAARGKEGGS